MLCQQPARFSDLSAHQHQSSANFHHSIRNTHFLSSMQFVMRLVSSSSSSSLARTHTHISHFAIQRLFAWLRLISSAKMKWFIHTLCSFIWNILTYVYVHALRSSLHRLLLSWISFQSCRILWTCKHHEIFVAAGLLLSRIHFISRIRILLYFIRNSVCFFRFSSFYARLMKTLVSAPFLLHLIPQHFICVGSETGAWDCDSEWYAGSVAIWAWLHSSCVLWFRSWQHFLSHLSHSFHPLFGCPAPLSIAIIIMQIVVLICVSKNL